MPSLGLTTFYECMMKNHVFSSLPSFSTPLFSAFLSSPLHLSCVTNSRANALAHAPYILHQKCIYCSDPRIHHHCSSFLLIPPSLSVFRLSSRQGYTSYMSLSKVPVFLDVSIPSTLLPKRDTSRYFDLFFIAYRQSLETLAGGFIADLRYRK